MTAVTERWPSLGNNVAYLLDSMPVMLASEKRRKRAKVASEVANCGYCGSKDVYYYGVNVHLLAIRRAEQLPRPEYLEVTADSNHDLTVLEGLAPFLRQGSLYADKAYSDALVLQILAAQESTIQTPIKKAKGQERLHWFEQLFSTAVSRVRQPVESFFNWVEEHTGIQCASKVRSLKGLNVHVFGRLTVAMLLLNFNS
ncbi:transposase IS4 family protein [Candidatus Vecturithrix granuli]|uniref:Transposase IS4 family protein n=1 Tax=Vecturithrix granuli TaxID=1499967 RepID=A0A0S6W5V2_VECG1|nr:transposase IS4 family protein [Candidatus Vecturithrix granuli]